MSCICDVRHKPDVGALAQALAQLSETEERMTGLLRDKQAGMKKTGRCKRRPVMERIALWLAVGRLRLDLPATVMVMRVL